MRYRVGLLTDIGRKRQQNQDNGGAFPELGLFVVADGMGGHKGGEIASAMAVEVVQKIVARERGLGRTAAEALTTAIQQASLQIHERASNQPQLQGMGTTTVSLLLDAGKVTIGHVGDSRAYFFRPGEVWQLTRDHSLVQEKLRAGLITREQVRTDRMKNVITRSVGFESLVEVEIYEMATRPGDLFLLCSDGLSGLIEDSEILEAITPSFFSGSKRDPQAAVQALVHAANESGGDDNITALIVEILDSEDSAGTA